MMPMPPGPGLSTLAKWLIVALVSPFGLLAAVFVWCAISVLLANDEEEHY